MSNGSGSKEKQRSAESGLEAKAASRDQKAAKSHSETGFTIRMKKNMAMCNTSLTKKSNLS